MIWLMIILLLFIFQVATILFSEYRHPAKAVAWMSILFILPLIGFVMYYFMAKSYRQRRRISRKTHRMMQEQKRHLIRQTAALDQMDKKALAIYKDVRLFGLLDNLPGSVMTKCNEVDLFNNGRDMYAAMLDAMRRAQDHIHLEFYTIRDDGIGEDFRHVMVEKANEGVEVRLMYDGIGSLKITDGYLRILHEAGVETGCFLPPLFALADKRLNYRNHRKIAVIDGKVGFLGGMNIGDEYLGKHPDLGYWRDAHLKIEGDAVYYLQQTFIQDWYFVKGDLINGSRYLPEHHCQGEHVVQIVNSGPDAHWDLILEVYFSAIAAAKHRLYIATPYFIPEPGIILGLQTAAMSGVDVRLLIPSVADSQIVYWASLSYVEDLLLAGVRVFKYERGFVHSKVLVADDMIASVGSANMDMRSLFSNFEQNALLYDADMVDRVADGFLRDLGDSREIRLEEFQRRSRWLKAKEKVCRLLSPLF